MSLAPKQLLDLLNELAYWLEFYGCESIEWVVCGGAAMALQNLNMRLTVDVDVLGQWDSTLMELIQLTDFPEKVKTCIRRVVESHPELSGFKTNWVNLGPKQLAAIGLPKGFAQRLTPIKFGKTLTLRLLDRVDLLPLKLYAASDEFSPRQEIHFQDLKALNPTFDELDEGINWMRSLEDFEERRTELRTVLGRLDHEDLAYYV